MARERRGNEQHGYFHIWNRGVDQQDIFIDDLDREVFIDLLGEAAEEFGVEIHAFALMSNHFHVIVNCPDGGLSAFAQQVQRRYVEHLNRRADRTGHLFTGRFRSTLLSDESARENPDDVMMVMVRYVHRNPLDRLRLADLARDRFSSYGCYVGQLPTPHWLRTDLVLALHQGRARLRAFTERAHPSDKTPGRGRVVEPYATSEVVDAVGLEFGSDPAMVRSPRSADERARRDLAVELCVALRTTTVLDLAVWFEVTPRAIRRMAARSKGRCGTDPTWHVRRTSIAALLWNTHVAHRAQAA